MSNDIDSSAQALSNAITNALHGNSLDSQRQTYLYQLTDVSTGDVLKYGITSEPNPVSRYSAGFYAATNSQMQVLATYQNRIGARIGELGSNIGY